jgi:hypothetical protein
MEEVTLLSPEKLDLIYGDVDSEGVNQTVSELKSLHTQLRDSQGEKIHQLVNDLNRSREMLDREYDDLIYSIEEFEDTDPISRLNEGNNRLIEFTRHLHSYLSMCHSLREHSYRIRNKVDIDGIDEEYSENLQETKLATEGSFVSDFRNYIQHRRIPVVTGKAKSDGKSEILLNKDELLDWDKWSPEAETRLDQLEAEFGVRDEIEHYQNINEEFYDWFYNYIANQCQNEIEERNDLIDEMVETQNDLVPELNS